MKLADIRAKTAYNPNALPSQKQAARDWLRGMHMQYPVALTLTLKQHLTEQTAAGNYTRKVTKADCEKAAERFTKKLNRAVFGNAAERYGKKLNYLVVIEGERSCKNLHLHLAIGNLPAHVKFNAISELVNEARKHVQHLDEQYKVDIADSGWFEYMTKELGAKDTDNVLWHLA